MATTVADRLGTGPMVPEPYRVVDRAQDTPDTWTLALEPVSGAARSVAPGQFMMVYAFGVGEVPISVSGLPEPDEPLRLTVRDVGDVTRAICAAAPGTVLGVRGPLGNDWPLDAAAGGDVAVLAGGIGLAPLRALVLRSLARRAEFGSVTLLYGARTPADLLYTAQLEEWRRTADVGVTVDAADRSWAGRVGVVTQLLPGARFRPEVTTAFVCGPEIMMRFAAQALASVGVAPGRIFVSMERHMDCGIGLCGHCQLGPTLICRDGPIYAYDRAGAWLEAREL